MKYWLARLLLAHCGAMIAASVLCAQTAISLRGRVVDELGAIIPGARVTLRAADGGKRNAVANASGDFSIPNLPPGVYTLTVEFKGFRAYIQDGLQVPTDAPLKITLTVAPVNAETDVKAETGGVSVEPDQNLSAIVLDERMIMDLLPDNEDDMRDFLQRSPARRRAAGNFILTASPTGGCRHVKRSSRSASTRIRSPRNTRVRAQAGSKSSPGRAMSSGAAAWASASAIRRSMRAAPMRQPSLTSISAATPLPSVALSSPRRCRSSSMVKIAR